MKRSLFTCKPLQATSVCILGTTQTELLTCGHRGSAWSPRPNAVQYGEGTSVRSVWLGKKKTKQAKHGTFDTDCSCVHVLDFMTMKIILPCMYEWCLGGRRYPAGGGDLVELNCQLRHLLHCGHGWKGLSDAGPRSQIGKYNYYCTGKTNWSI